MIDLHQLASSLNYESWTQIKAQVNNLALFPKEPAATIPLAKRVYANKQEITTSTEVEALMKGRRLFYIIAGNRYSASSLTAEFACVACGGSFKVEYNPARYHMDCPLCKRCKKSIVHKCQDYQERYESTMLRNHGVKRPLQSEKSFEKFKASMYHNHGVSFSGQSPLLLAKTRKKLLFGGKSELERIVGQRLVEIYGSSRVNLDQKIQVEPKRWIYPDVVIDGNLVVEIYGDYWHGNPALYQPDDMVSHCYAAKDVWAWDSNRVKLAKSQGYAVFVIWETAWKKTQKAVLEQLDETIRTSFM